MTYQLENKKNELQSICANGGLSIGDLRHGHTFLQLSDMRVYMNLMYDIADDEPLLWDLIDRKILRLYSMGKWKNLPIRMVVCVLCTACIPVMQMQVCLVF